jgi:plastocyanin
MLAHIIVMSVVSEVFMKKYYCLYTLLAALTMFLGAAISSDVLAGGNSTKVEIKNYKFGPEVVNVKPGESVVWENLDGSAHTILIDGKESHRLGKGADYSQVFSKPGSYKYQCGLHSSMKGVINVTGAGGQSMPVPSSAQPHSIPSAPGAASNLPKPASMPKPTPAPKKVTASSGTGIKKIGSPSPVVVSADAAGKEAAGNVVSIVDFMRFSPEVLTVTAGTEVTWNNLDGSNHIILMGDVRSPRLHQHVGFSHIFDKPGEYSYICGIHGDKMSGKIIVK